MTAALLPPPDALRGELAAALAAVDGAADPAAHWQRGFVLTAMGRYGSALAALGLALEGAADVRAAAHLTRAALLRQLGLHARAQREDDAGLAALDASTADPEGVQRLRTGLLIGRVADAVGLGAAPQELRRRLADASVAEDQPWRLHVRYRWVQGEVALTTGSAEAALEAFARARARSVAVGARRHEAKSLLFLAGAHTALADARAGRELARLARELADGCGAAPLRWPALLILAETDPAHADAYLRAGARTLRGILDSLPSALRTAAAERPPASWLLPYATAPAPG